MTQSDRMRILTMLEECKLTAAEAERLLLAAEDGREAAEDRGRSRHAFAEAAGQRPRVGDIGSAIASTLDKVAEVVDRIPEKVGAAHLARVGKGVGLVVDALTDVMDQGLSILAASKFDRFEFADAATFADLDGLAHLRVSNTAGRVEVVAQDRPEIRIDVAATIRAATRDAAEQVHAGNPIVMHREGDTLRIAPAAALTEGLKSLLGQNRYDFAIRVPKRLAVSLAIDDLGGDVSIEGFSSADTVAVKGVSGEIRLVGCSGAIDVNTVSGDVTAESCAGAHRIRTVSGEITVKRVQGASRADLASVSGDVQLEGDLAGPAAIKTVSGDVSASIQTRTALAISTTSGDLDVTLLSGSGGYVDASSRSGDLDVALQLDDAMGGKRYVRGRLDGGTDPLTFSTISGDMQIRRT